MVFIEIIGDFTVRNASFDKTYEGMGRGGQKVSSSKAKTEGQRPFETPGRS